MRNFIIMAAVGCSIAAPAMAAERLTDAQFVRASRCLGLAETKALGEVDPAALQTLVKVQRQGRHVSTSDRAEAARRDARREASKAQGDVKSALVDERDGACKQLGEASSAG